MSESVLGIYLHQLLRLRALIDAGAGESAPETLRDDMDMTWRSLTAEEVEAVRAVGAALNGTPIELIRSLQVSRGEVERLARELADWQSGRRYAGGHDGQPIDVARRVYKTVADALGLTAEERRAWCPAEKIATLRAEAARLRAVIEGAPHETGCSIWDESMVCGCWKASALGKGGTAT